MMRYAAQVADGTVVEVLVVADGQQGDATISALGLVEEQGVRPGIGWSWDGSTFAAPVAPLTWEDIRRYRDRRLAGSDWTQLADAPVDSAAWAVYRQALRDVPQDFASPDAVVWPVAP